MDSKTHPLKPDDTVHKILISTTSQIIGEYVSDELVITHAWHHFSNPAGIIRMRETPVSRAAYIVAFRTESYEKKLASNQARR